MKKDYLCLFWLREFYKNSVKEEKDKVKVNGKWLDRKVWLSQERSRRNFVRRVYKRNKLFAIEEIQSRYPGYTEANLFLDLPVKPRAVKRSKHKPLLDIRRSQLLKLAYNLKERELNEKEYQATCNRIALLQHAHNLRLPVPLAVTINRELKVYSFHWRIRENLIKSFVSLANSAGITHQRLESKHSEMCSSSFSY